MTRFLSSRHDRLTGSRALVSAGRAVWSLAMSAIERRRNRRAVAKLWEWDDRQLADIGLTRADLALSLALPVREDPSLRLMHWTLERRVARLQRQREEGRAARAQARLVSDEDKRSSIAITSR